MTIRQTGAKPAPFSTLLQRLVLAAVFGAIAPLTTASAQVVDQGTTATAWAPATVRGPAVTPGTWRAGGPNPEQSNFRLVKESAHFAFYSDETVSDADLNLAADTLENVVWQNLFNANLESAAFVAERIRSSVAGTMIALSPALQLSVTVSIGVACLNPGDAEGDPAAVARDWIAQADTLLYVAKEAGRNRVVSVPPATPERLSE